MCLPGYHYISIVIPAQYIKQFLWSQTTVFSVAKTLLLNIELQEALSLIFRCISVFLLPVCKSIKMYLIFIHGYLC